MPIMSRITVGTPGEARHPDAIKAAIAEFFSVLIFVFAGEGSGMAYEKLTGNGSATASGLITSSLSHVFALIVAESVGTNISERPREPGRDIWRVPWRKHTLLTAILYWISQLFGSVVACLLLKFATGGMETTAFTLSSGVSPWNAVVLEIVMTFGLVYTVYATAMDPRKGELGIIAPIASGFIVGANTLTGGAFDGGSMNPVVSFGPAVVSWTWTNHWVDWFGPFIGAAIAAIVYDNIFISNSGHEPLSSNVF